MAVGGDDQNPLGPQVEGRAQRRQLAQGPIAIIVAADPLGRKDGGNGGGGQQGVQGQLGGDILAPPAASGLPPAMHLNEADRVSRGGGQCWDWGRGWASG